MSALKGASWLAPSIGRVLLMCFTISYYMYAICAMRHRWLLWILSLNIFMYIYEFWLSLSINILDAESEWTEYYWTTPPLLIFLTSMIVPIGMMRVAMFVNWRVRAAFDDTHSTLETNVQRWTQFCVEAPFHTYTMMVENVTTFSWAMITKNISQNTTLCKRVIDIFGDKIVAEQFLVMIMVVMRSWLSYQQGVEQIAIYALGSAQDIVEFGGSIVFQSSKELLNSKTMLAAINVAYFMSMYQFAFNMDARKKMNEGLKLLTFSKMPWKLKSLALTDAMFGTELWAICLSIFTQDGIYIILRMTVILEYKAYNVELLFYMVKNYFLVIIQIFRGVNEMIDHQRYRDVCRAQFLTLERMVKVGVWKDRTAELNENKRKIRELYLRYKYKPPKRYL